MIEGTMFGLATVGVVVTAFLTGTSNLYVLATVFAVISIVFFLQYRRRKGAYLKRKDGL